MIKYQWQSRVEVPEFSRCCLCLPLRPALLVWGYLKMIFLVTLAFWLMKDLIRVLTSAEVDVLVLMFGLVSLVLIDIVFNVMFVIAGHMKYHKLFKLFYMYCLVFLVVFVLCYVAVLGSLFYSFRERPAHVYLYMTLNTLYIAIPVVVIQGYVALLARSEARKLDNSTNIQFVNTADAHQQSMVNNEIE